MRLGYFRLVSWSAVLLFAASCVSDPDIDPGEGVDDLGEVDGPTVEFNPSARVIPFPNNLLLDRMTGKVNLPASCNESASAAVLREGVLNRLDGFGTFKTAISVTFTEPVDAASLDGNVLLYKRATGMTPVDPSTATAIPVVVIPGQTARASADCSSMSAVDNAIFVPLIPLEGGSTYTVGIVGAVKTMSGKAFLPSATWTLIRSAENPVTINDAGDIVSDRTPFDPIADKATLEGLNLLWRAHAQAVGFLQATGQAREQVLLAWDFNTQTTTNPLDPTVAGSLASKAPTMPLAQVASITGGNTQAFLEAALGGANNCAAVGCANVGDVVAGALIAPQYQSTVANPLPGGAPVPSSWPDPINPSSRGNEPITAFAFIPATAAPANGYPVIIFGHGVTRAKTDMFAIGSQLAGAGFVTIAIDWVAHSSRAIRIRNDAASGCGDVGSPPMRPDPSTSPQCFAPILSTNLAATRDGLRQAALDGLALIESLKACGTANCNSLMVDATRIGYVGHSLGSIIGSMIVAMSPDIRAAVLNVGGAGLIDIIEHTDSLGIRCPIVDGLITGGIIAGEPLDLTATPPTGTCLGDSWKADPGFRRFAVIARWALDAGDNANYMSRLAGKKVLLQEVIDDGVVPNFATDQMGMLLGMTPAAADTATGLPVAPSAAITANPTTPLWVTYTMNAANSYNHGSILKPATLDPMGQLGTAQMQTDFITYLVLNTSAQ